MLRQLYAALFAMLIAATSPGELWAGALSTGIQIGVQISRIPPATSVLRNSIFTSGAAARNVELRGFQTIRLRSRGATNFIYSAVSKENGLSYLITVAAWQGRIVAVNRT